VGSNSTELCIFCRIKDFRQQFRILGTNTMDILPREKLESMGARALTDEELLAVMLGTGTKGCPVSTLAARVLPHLERSAPDIDVSALLDVPGIGPSKALLLAASLEFSRRRIRPDGVRIRSAKDVLPLLQHLIDRPQEHVVSISLSGAHEVIKTRTVSIGLLTSCPVHPREVFVGPISDHAYSVILAHNHPSGDPTPSAEDRQVTGQIAAAAKTLGMKLLDHIIFARRGYFSFQENGEL
jgi:DNA repair protein RadC